MSVRNSYPEKPVVPYVKTVVSVTELAEHIKTAPYPDGVKQAALTIIANESGWGAKGINNNIAGIQADSGRWDSKFDSYIVGTTVLNEGRTGKARRFCTFASWKLSVNMLLDRVYNRGLYVGGTTNLITRFFVSTLNDFVNAYYREWVTGKSSYTPSLAERNDTISIYNSAGRRLALSVVKAAPVADEKKK